MTFEEHIRRLLEDIQNSSDLMERDASAYFKQFDSIPPMLPLGDGKMLQMGAAGLKSLHAIARLVRSEVPGLAAALNEKETANFVGQAIGELLAQQADASKGTIGLPSDAGPFKQSLRTSIEQRLQHWDAPRTHLFGAWVFQDPRTPTVAVGPVLFKPIEVWLNEAEQSGLIDRNQTQRILQRLNGCVTRKDIARAIIEDEIADTIGPCPWVCTVTVKGHSAQRSHEKAILAAKMALVAIGLAWNEPSRSARDAGLLFELGPSRIRATMAYSGDKFVWSSHGSDSRLGRFLAEQDFAKFIKYSTPRLKTVGDAIGEFLALASAGPKSKLQSRLCHALMWYGEASRETLDFLAIVKFAAALDTLSNGGKAHGICDLVAKRLPVKDRDGKFLTDGTSLKSLVDRIYNAGRSRIVHGSRPSLVDDLGELRVHSEWLATITLRACIHWLEHYNGADEESAFRTSGN